MVLLKLEELQIPFEQHNIADSAVVEDLISRGGKQQVPYLVDPKTGTEMYESADIVEYLDTHYGNPDGNPAAQPA